MRKSQWKPVPGKKQSYKFCYFIEDPQEQKEQHQTSDGEQERPAMTVGDLRKIFGLQRKNDDHGKTFGTGYKSHVLHSGVDQNRNVPNQEPQERSGRPALTVGDLLKIYGPQMKNDYHGKAFGTGYKSHVLHSGVDQNRNVPNQGNKIAINFHVPEHHQTNNLHGPQRKNEVHDQNEPKERNEKTPVKSVKGEQDKDDIQKTVECSLDKTEAISATVGDLLKKIDKGENDKYDLLKQIGDLLRKLDKITQEKDKIAQEKEVLQHNLEQLKKEIERKKDQFKSAWRDIPLYADWRKEEFQTVNLTLDAATAHPAVFLSEEGRRVTWQEPCQDLPSCPERFVSRPCVLGQLHVSSGRYFWEVEVQNAHSWDLGVCRNNVARNEMVTMSPQNGFWAIRLYDGEYWGLTTPETSLTLKEKPLRVGVFLDYEARDVSFYNMTDGSHIYTFSNQTFYGVLRPLFRLWSSDSGSLTIVQVV